MMMKRCSDGNDSERTHKKQRTQIEEDSDWWTKAPESPLWAVTRFLGNNSHASVYLADGDDDSLPSQVVIKSNEISQASRLKKEEDFLTRLTSPFVVSCYGHEITQDHKAKYYNTILEYCPHQTLAKHIIRGKGLPEEAVKGIASDILLGLKYIHGEKIIHCDIKPKNILLLLSPQDTPIRAKISGFGEAMEDGSIEYGEGWGHRRGTTRFMSPELIRDMFLDYGSDVWAFGCTVLEMLTGERAWAEHGELDWEDWIHVIGETNLVPYVPDSLSEDAQDLLDKCFERDPFQRWSVDSLIKHPFLTCKHKEEQELDQEETFDQDKEEPYDADVEAGLQNREAFEQEEEEEEYIYDADVEAYEAGLKAGHEFEQEDEASEIDEEYPVDEDSEEEL